MVARIAATAVMLLLAANAFCGDAPGAGQVFNPFGIMCLAASGIVWFARPLARSGTNPSCR
jgi:hypothetical protein